MRLVIFLAPVAVKKSVVRFDVVNSGVSITQCQEVFCGTYTYTFA